MHRSRLPSSKTAFAHNLGAFDAVCSLTAPIGALALRDPNILVRDDKTAAVVYVLAASFVCAAALVRFRVACAMSRYFSFYDAVTIAKAASVGVAISSLLLFSFTRLDDIPRSVPLIHFLVLSAMLVGGRVLRRAIELRSDLGEPSEITHADEEHVLIVGANRLAWFYIRVLDTFTLGHRKVVAILDDDPRAQGRTIFGHLVMGGISSAATLLDEFAQHGIAIRGLVVCERDRARAYQVRRRLEPICATHGVEIELLAHRLDVFDDQTTGDGRQTTDLSSVLRLLSSVCVKRSTDVVLASIAVVVLSPFFLLAATLVAADIGLPALFWQRRMGRHGKAIYLYKFRTLRNPFDEFGRKRSDEERLSLIGRFLRATRLDELPQLFSVLRGDMSIVGPRPLLPADQPEQATLRLSVPPGLTGWAQIHGGKLITAEEKNALDEWYVRNAGFWLDVQIMVRTAWIVLFGDRRDEAALRNALERRSEEEANVAPVQ